VKAAQPPRVLEAQKESGKSRLHLTSRVFPILWLAVALVAASLGVGGCGDSGTPTSSADSSGSDDGRKAPPTPFKSLPDGPPEGVKGLVQYYQEGGPPACRNEDETDQLSMSFGVSSLPRKGKERFNPRPRIGDSLAVCVRGVLGEEEVKVEFDSPGSTPPPVVERGFRSPGEYGLVMMYLFLAPEYGFGQWHLTAHAEGRSAEMDMWIGRPVAPGYVHSATRGHRYVDFVVAGLEPNQEFTMHFYAPHDEDLLAEYVSSARGRVGPEGMTTMTIDAAGATSTCYIAKLEVAGGIVDDLHNTLSHFCPRIEDK
jgi:hypothetical protein